MTTPTTKTSTTSKPKKITTLRARLDGGDYVAAQKIEALFVHGGEQKHIQVTPSGIVIYDGGECAEIDWAVIAQFAHI